MPKLVCFRDVIFDRDRLVTARLYSDGATGGEWKPDGLSCVLLTFTGGLEQLIPLEQEGDFTTQLLPILQGQEDG